MDEISWHFPEAIRDGWISVQHRKEELETAATIGLGYAWRAGRTDEYMVARLSE